MFTLITFPFGMFIYPVPVANHANMIFLLRVRQVPSLHALTSSQQWVQKEDAEAEHFQPQSSKPVGEGD
jgi:hypothetical protein